MWLRVNGTSKHTKFEPVENSSGYRVNTTSVMRVFKVFLVGNKDSSTMVYNSAAKEAIIRLLATVAISL